MVFDPTWDRLQEEADYRRYTPRHAVDWHKERYEAGQKTASGPDEPTWRLVLSAAERLTASRGEFRLQDLVVEVQRMDPGRGRGTIQPVVQGMTSNAGSGPPSPCGKPLVRVGHGVYKLAKGSADLPHETGPLPRPSVDRRASWGRSRNAAEVTSRLGGLIAEFPACVYAYDRLVPFRRVGQYEAHRVTIETRRHWHDVRDALDDDRFLWLLRETLQRWGIGRRASRLAPLGEFRERLRAQAGPISALDGVRIDDPALDVPAVAQQVWEVIENLRIVSNLSVIVPGTKTLHHLLPDLVPPMDRAWTGAFFLWSAAAPQYAQATTFTRTFTRFAQVAQAVRPAEFVGDGWRTSRTKVLDNAVIGYCKIHGIEPNRT
jgi:hypothetical protein